MFYLTTHSTHFIYGYMTLDIWYRMEGNVLFNDALNTFYLRLYDVRHMVQEGRKEMFYLTTHSTHFIYGYMTLDIWYRKEGNVLFNDALNTFYLRLYDVRHMVQEGRKEMFYLTTHSTHFIYGYMTLDIWYRKEGNVLFNDALNTFYLRLYDVRHMVQEGRKEMFYLTTHSAHFIYGYMTSYIWYRTTQIGKGLLFPINSKGSFICTTPHTG